MNLIFACKQGANYSYKLLQGFCDNIESPFSITSVFYIVMQY